MKFNSTRRGGLVLLALLALPATGSLSAQELRPSGDEVGTTVVGTAPTDLTGLPEGPKIDGIISARKGDRMKVTTSDGTTTVIAISEATEIRSSKGLFGGNSGQPGAQALLTGLPVSVKTVKWGPGLVASQVRYKKNDFKTAAMIHNGTDQRFGEHDEAIELNAEAAARNAAATEALRGRLGDIDKYNVKSTTNVYFDSGKSDLSARAKYDLCAATSEADAMDNALLLVVGYTDSVGNPDANQLLSEKRAGRVVNYIQQYCGWKPWRMLAPTGMASAAPAASNETREGQAQNRRVSVNVLVSKALDAM